ncbi:MAG: alpha/beta hydrolase [Treponema sp.]|nr:alpha/beta hydrolase [Treponema sp.]
MSKLSQILAANKVRKQFGTGDKKRDEGQKTPENVVRFDNIRYGNARRLKKWQLLDVYRPKDETCNCDGASTDKASVGLKPLPVIVIVHGGAWVYGDKDVYQFYGMRLAQRGFVVVNFSYRLAPEAKFPSSLIDTDTVFRWVFENAQEYGFDVNNIFAVGDSAGAHLLALYSSAVTNPDFAKELADKFDFTIQPKCPQNSQSPQPSQSPLPEPPRPFLKGIALNCGKYDMSENLENDVQMRLLLQALMPGGGTEEELKLINAAGHVTKDFPPAFVMTCKGDFLVGQAPVILNALEQAGVKHEYHCYGTQENPLWHVFHCDPHLPEAVICNDDECNFFKGLSHQA